MARSFGIRAVRCDADDEDCKRMEGGGHDDAANLAAGESPAEHDDSDARLHDSNLAVASTQRTQLDFLSGLAQVSTYIQAHSVTLTRNTSFKLVDN